MTHPLTRRTWIRAVALAALAMSAGRAASAPPASVEALQQQIEAHVSQARFAPALWGIKVISLETGRTLYEHQAGRLMSPASNSKLYTAALALDRFGGDYRIVTPLLASQRPDGEGRVVGDLVVSGRGDPSWKAHPRRGDFWAAFQPFVTALNRAGVRRITGDLIADATYFRMPPYGASWTVDDLLDDYGAEISAVSFEENYADLRVLPGRTAGEVCSLEWMHPFTGLELRNRTVTTAAGGSRSLHAWRAPGDRVVYLMGGLPVDGAEEMLDLTVPQPASWFAAALAEALARAGIVLEGRTRSVRWPETTPVTPSFVRVGVVTSPPLREVIEAFLKPSQNLETDLIFAHVGEAARTADTPDWRTSESLALGALRDFLRQHDLPVDDVRFDEGSGLSRNNLTTAHATVALLRCMATHRDGAAFAAALPLAGVDGTLRRRMRLTAAEGNVRAKTGTLRWASTISGYVTSAAGERLAFSVMLNRSVAAPGRFARDDIDPVAVMLAEWTGRTAP